jgi:hypothetical protein
LPRLLETSILKFNFSDCDFNHSNVVTMANNLINFKNLHTLELIAKE